MPGKPTARHEAGQVEQAGLMLGGVSLLAADATLLRGVPLEQVERPPPRGREVLRGVAGTGSTLVFAEADALC